LHYTVYKTTNIINGNYYIGQHRTKNLNDEYLGSGTVISDAIAKHGRENFSKEILFVFDNFDDMNNKEIELVDHKDPKCYNARGGGQSPKACLYDPELQKANLRLAAVKGQETTRVRKETIYGYDMWLSYKQSVCKKKLYQEQDHHWLGKPHKQESKDKIGKINSLLQTGSGNSQYGSMWITDGVVNKKIKKNEELPFGFRKGRNIGRGY